ncbi:MAG: hypothetical protein RIS75_707 [Actinomycetota bacterium]
MVRVRLLQVESNASESVESRIKRVLEQLPEHAAATDFLVLPELWHVGAFDLAGARDNAQPLSSSLITELAAVAANAKIWLHGGSVAIRNEDGTTTNTSLVFNPAGELVGQYQKQHLFGFADGERTVMTAGNDVVVIDTPLGRTGLATCYDLRFPELFRSLTDKSAQTFLICAGWPTPRISHWDILAQARAIENQAYVVACNGRGAHAGVVLGGHSIVVNPRGEIIAHASESDEYLDAEIDIDLVDQWRSAFPVLADRRNL